MKPELARLLHHEERGSDPQARKKPRHQASNSVRCQLYRHHKQQYEDALVAKIAALKHELASLQHGLWQERTLMRRHVSMGSLDKITREYFACFEYGLASVVAPPSTDGLSLNQRLQIEKTNDRVRSQEAFVHHLMDPQVAVGPLKGVNSMLMILRRITLGFANSRKVLTSLEITGSEESPVVIAWTVTHAIVTMDSFRAYFPSVSTDNELLHKYLHTPVAIESKTAFHFTRDGRVERVAAELNYMTSLVNSGWNVADAARALSHGRVPKAIAKIQQVPVLRDSPALSVLNPAPSYPSREFLMALVRECCVLFGIGIEKAPPPVSSIADRASKEAFLRRVLDTNVAFGKIVGVDAVIRLWLHIVDILVDVRKQITNIFVAGNNKEPILIVHMNNEIVSILSQANSSVWNNWDFDLHCSSKAQFLFTQDGRISFCSFDSGCFEALLAAGVGLEETCEMLQWFSAMQPQGASATDQSQERNVAVEKFTQSIPRNIQLNPPQKCRPKSNSERGLAFRLRRKEYEIELEESVVQLRAYVAQLQEQLNELQHQVCFRPQTSWRLKEAFKC